MPYQADTRSAGEIAPFLGIPCSNGSSFVQWPLSILGRDAVIHVARLAFLMRSSGRIGHWSPSIDTSFAHTNCDHIDNPAIRFLSGLRICMNYKRLSFFAVTRCDESIANVRARVDAWTRYRSIGLSRVFFDGPIRGSQKKGGRRAANRRKRHGARRRETFSLRYVYGLCWRCGWCHRRHLRRRRLVEKPLGRVRK